MVEASSCTLRITGPMTCNQQPQMMPLRCPHIWRRCGALKECLRTFSDHEQRGRSANGIELHPNWWIYGRHAPRMASRSHEHSEAAADPHVRLQYRILLRQMIGTATPHGLQERLTSGLF
jgi:hypothetical protein